LLPVWSKFDRIGMSIESWDVFEKGFLACLVGNLELFVVKPLSHLLVCGAISGVWYGEAGSTTSG